MKVIKSSNICLFKKIYLLFLIHQALLTELVLILPSVELVTLKQTGGKMKILKKILVVVILVASILLIGWAGELDHHEYIEANYTYAN